MRLAVVCATGAELECLRQAAAGAEVVPWDGAAAPAGGCDAAVVTRAGVAIAALRALVQAGRPVLAAGAGCAPLCEAGLLPGALVPLGPSAAEPAAAPTHVRVQGRPTPFTWAIPAGRVVRVGAPPPVRRYTQVDRAALQASGRVLFRYCDPAGGVDGGDDPAGLCDDRGNVVAILPGRDLPTTWWSDGLGRQLLESLRLRGRI